MNTPEPFNDLSWNDDPLHSPNRTEYIEKLRARVKELEAERDRTQGSVCSFCNWANVGTLNIGDPNETSVWICHGCVKRQHSKLTALEKEVSRLRNYLERAGWGECNIPACNCNGWHKLRESSDERQMFEDMEILRRKNDALEKEVSDLREKLHLQETTEDPQPALADYHMSQADVIKLVNLILSLEKERDQLKGEVEIARDALWKINTYPVHSVVGALDLQDIASNALSAINKLNPTPHDAK